MCAIIIDNPSQVFRCGKMINMSAEELRQQKASIDQVRNALVPSWTGSDAEKYLNDLNIVSAYLNSTITILDNYGISIQNAMSRYSNISEN